MKILKKLFSVSLALVMVLTMFSSMGILSSAETTVEEINVDLTKSTSLGTSNVSVSAYRDGAIRTSFAPGWFPSNEKDVTSIVWPDAMISLKNSAGEFVTIPAGYKYIINVKYTVTKVNQTPQIAIIYSESDNKTSTNIGERTLAYSQKHSAVGNFVLTAVTEGVSNRPLRLAFGGGGNIAVESVEIERVATGSDAKIVNYVDEGRTTKGFAFDTLKTPTFRGALHAVFGGWFTDASFTNAATTVTDGATYYAKWTSVTRDIDLGNANRMANYNNGENNTVLNITPNTENNTLKAVVNQTVGGNIYNGGNGHNDNKQQVTLEYADYDDLVQDGIYNNYVSMKAGKQYGITVKFSVVAVSSKAQISVSSAASNLSYDASSQICAVNSSITATGNYTLFSKTGANGFIDCTYGGSAANDKLRLCFEGNGTFIIESVTIQEVYTADVNAGNVIIVNGSDSNYTAAYKVAAAKDLNGNWQMPVLPLDSHIGAEFGGWYTDSAFKTAMTTPVFNTTYYAKWDYAKTNVNLSNLNLMAGGSNDLILTKPTADTLFTAKFQRYDQNLFTDGSFTSNGTAWLKSTSVSLEYFDNDPQEQDIVYNGYVAIKSGCKYVVNVNYNVTNASYDTKYYPQIAIITNATNLSENAVSTVWAARKHTAVGEDFVLSAVVDGATAGHKLRLAFGGVGTVEIKSIEITEVRTDATIYNTVKLTDNGVSVNHILKDGAELPELPRTVLYNFAGWYNGDTKVTEITSDVELTSKWADKYDINMDETVDILDMIKIKSAILDNSANLNFDIDRDDTVAAADMITLKRYFFDSYTIGNNDATAFSAVAGSYKSLLTNLAIDTLVAELGVSTDETKARKIYVGIKDIDEEILNNEAFDNLVGVKGDVYGLNDYKVFIYNEDVYIEAGSDYAAAFAVNQFIDFVKAYRFFPEGIAIEGKYNGEKDMLDGYGYVSDQGDEFNGEKLNTNRWYLTVEDVQGTNYSKSSSYYLSSLASLSNSDSSDDFGGPWIDPEGNPNMQDGVIKYINEEGNNYSVTNGLLTLTTKKVDGGYTATKINAKQNFGYGIMTARVKLATKNGACSTVWSRTVDNNGASVNEMDFVENYGSEQIIPNLHAWNNNTEDTDFDGRIDVQNTILPNEGESLSDSFHDIALYWTNEKIAFYFDGVLYLEQDITDKDTWEAFHKTTHMIFGISAPSNYYADLEGKNGSKPGDIMGSLINSFSESMYIDYVRVFQK